MNLESMNLLDGGGVRATENEDSPMDVDEDDNKMHAQDSISAGQDMPVRLKNDTSDIDSVQECDLLDCRGNFLNLCCRNYYQFDQVIIYIYIYIYSRSISQLLMKAFTLNVSRPFDCSCVAQSTLP